MDRPAGASSRMVTVIGFLAIIAACYFARGLLLPLAMAALVSLLLGPLVARVERCGIGRGGAGGGGGFSAFRLVVSFGWVVSLQIPDLTEKLPSYRKNLTEKIGALGPAGDSIRRLTSSFEEMGQEVASSAQGKERPPVATALPAHLAQSSPAGTLGGTLLNILETLGTTLVILILVVFLLIYQSDLRDRMIHLSGHGHVQITTQTMGE